MLNQLIKIKQTKKQSGFSLIEILIAMAIMAVMIGMAVPYLGGASDKYAKQEINRLLAAIEMVRDLAVIENKEYGLTIDEEGYQFLVLNDEDDTQPARWEIISEHPVLSQHELPDTIEVNVSIDGDNIFAAKEDEVEIFEEDIDIFEDEEEQEKVDPPQIYFLSTGEQNQFVLAVASSENYQSDKDEAKFFRIKGNLAGELKYQGPLPGTIFNDIDREYSDYLEGSDYEVEQ
jgi:general secretion pathway protein H